MELRVMEIRPYLEVREDGKVRNIRNDPRVVGWRDGVIKSTGYRVINQPLTHKQLQVHRLVAEAFLPNPYGVAGVVDHIDGNPLNNAVENLRWTTVRGNAQNREEHRGGKMVGARFCKKYKIWVSQAHYNGITKHLGHF